jgi:hypothetical protein
MSDTQDRWGRNTTQVDELIKHAGKLTKLEKDLLTLALIERNLRPIAPRLHALAMLNRNTVKSETRRQMREAGQQAQKNYDQQWNIFVDTREGLAVREATHVLVVEHLIDEESKLELGEPWEGSQKAYARIQALGPVGEELASGLIGSFQGTLSELVNLVEDTLNKRADILAV